VSSAAGNTTVLRVSVKLIAARTGSRMVPGLKACFLKARVADFIESFVSGALENSKVRYLAGQVATSSKATPRPSARALCLSPVFDGVRSIAEALKASAQTIEKITSRGFFMPRFYLPTRERGILP
jgi:hypothetical protein